jgi:hypothetical protein
MSLQDHEIGVKLEELRGDIETLAILIFANRRFPSGGEIRAASAILRKWLLEGGWIGRIAKALGEELRFPTFDNSQNLEVVARTESIEYYYTGGIRVNGKPVFAIYYSNEKSGGAPLVDGAQIKPTKLLLSDFLGQRRVFYQGKYFTRETILRFVSNKLGGAHVAKLSFDDSERELLEAANYMTYGGPLELLRYPPSGQIHLHLEPQGVEPLSAFHLDVVEAAASFVQVEFAERGIAKITIKQSWLDRFRGIFPSRPKPGHYIADFGSEDQNKS